MTFEARLADAYDRYLAGAPVEVDPVTVAATVANASPGRRWSLSLPTSGPKRRVAILGVVALLLLATVATVLLVVGQLTDRPRVPWVYRNELVTSPDLPAPRAFSQLVVLDDGRVLTLGGDGSDAPTALILDPETGQTSRTGPFQTPNALSISSAVRLADGRVLLIGDSRPAEGPRVPVVELFDPATLELRDVGPTVVARSGAFLAALGDGRALVVGGLPPNRDGGTPEDLILDVEAYDPSTNAFSVVARLPLTPSFDSKLYALPDGRAAMTFQFQPDGGPTEVRIYLFDPAVNAFIQAARGVPGSATGPIVPYNASLVPLQDGKVLLVGEVTDPDGAVLPGVSIIWDPTAGTFEPTKPAPWQYQSALELDDGRLMLLGLASIEGPRPTSWAATFDLATGDAVLVQDLTACYPGAVKLADGRVAFIGGLEDCEIHNPDQGGQLAPAVPVVQIFQ